MEYIFLFQRTSEIWFSPDLRTQKFLVDRIEKKKKTSEFVFFTFREFLNRSMFFFQFNLSFDFAQISDLIINLKI